MAPLCWHHQRSESLPSRGGWIEIGRGSVESFLILSLPSRGGWIEMVPMLPMLLAFLVPPLTGRVD